MSLTDIFAEIIAMPVTVPVKAFEKVAEVVDDTSG